MDMKIQAGDESSKCLTDLSILILATQKEVNFIYAKAILFSKQIGGNRTFFMYNYCIIGALVHVHMAIQT